MRAYRARVVVEATLEVPGSGESADQLAEDAGADLKGAVEAALGRGFGIEALDVQVKRGQGQGFTVYESGQGPASMLADYRASEGA